MKFHEKITSMKKIILIGITLLSFNALSEEFNFAEFESELAELEAANSLEDANMYVDKISNLQSANDKATGQEGTNFSNQELYEIIPLPEMEDTQKVAPKMDVKTEVKRVRGY